MKHIIIINGVANSGKDSFVECVTQNVYALGYPGCAVSEYSSVDYIKKFAKKEFNWNGVKDDASRRMLSDLKDMFSKYGDIPFKKMMERVVNFYDDKNAVLLFLYIREPEEIERAVRCFNAQTLLICRDGLEIPDNHADKEVMEYKSYDYVVDNNGSFQHLEEIASQFVKECLKIPKFVDVDR